MYIIGITGPSGAGKNIAMRALEKLGALTLDCDEIYHRLLLSNADMNSEIASRFPDALTDGHIDRKKLGNLVFNNLSALNDLNNITHKFVFREIRHLMSNFEKQGGNITVINAIALIESGYSKKCDIVISIIAPEDERISRLTARDSLSREEIAARVNSQPPDSFFKENSDYVLENIYDNLDSFEEACMNTVLIDKWFSDYTDEMVEDLSRLVAINSVRGESTDGAPYGVDSRKALSAMQDILEKHDFQVDVFEDAVITTEIGPTPAQMGILTHLDIVAAGADWDTNPFELTIKDGRLFGRGVMDNKGPAIASVYAALCVRELFPQLSRGVRLIFGSCEETGFDDIAQYMKKNAMPPNVFSPDAGFPLINIEKGRYMPVFGAKWNKETTLPHIISIEGGKTPNIVPNSAFAVIEGIGKEAAESFCKKFTEKTGVALSIDGVDGNALTIAASGTASHASRPHLGNNAQTALVEMLASMPFAKSRGFEYICALARLFPHGDYYGEAIGLAMQDEISDKTTVNFGVLRFDELEFSASFDARTAICADKADLLAITRNALGRENIEITYHEIKPSHHTPEETPFVQALLRVYERCTGKKGECLSMGGLTYVHDIPGGVAFGCTRSEDDNNIHGPNEYIDIAELVSCAKIFTQAILEVCK